MKTLLPSQQNHQPTGHSTSGGGAAASGAGNAVLIAALEQAQAGDMTLLEGITDGDESLLTLVQQALSTGDTNVMGGITGEDAVWLDLENRIEETETQAHSFGGAAQPATAAIAAPQNHVPDAIEVNDTGPVQNWTSLNADIANSEAFDNQDQVQNALEPELGMDLGPNHEVHVDREAWRVANTYNCDAAIIGTHIYIHRRVEESISNVLWGTGGANALGGDRPGGLIQTEWRPPFAQLSGSDIVMTDGNYTIEMDAPTVIVYDQEGNEVTKIWGDPHVNENGSGSAQWHFGEDSTFILPDGTKICCDTEPNAKDEWYVVGVDVVSGGQRFHHGEGGETGMTQDAAEWDLANADRSDDASAGVFALQDNNQWAVQAADGQFYDINEESWSAYQNDRDIDHGALASGITDNQRAVAGDADLQNAGGGVSRREESESHAWVAMQEVEIDAATGQVINPLQYMPEAIQVFSRGAPNYIPAIDREMNVSNIADNEQRASNLVENELNVAYGWYNVHLDEEAWKVANAYNADAVLWGQEMFIHQDVYEAIREDYERPVVEDSANGATRNGFLMEPKWRAPFLKHGDSAIVITPGGYTIEMKGHEVIIYDDKGTQETRIWGDPHVNEGPGGDTWHFGHDSTFILPDGTKLCLDTKETSPGVYYTVGVDILCGSERYHYGEGGDQGMTEDAVEWDGAHADSASDAHAGVFAMQENGEWAILADDGKFYDITDETWSQYLKDKDVDFDPNKLAVGLTEEQLAVADDRDIKLREEALRNGWGLPRETTTGGQRVRRFERLFVEAEVMALLVRDDIVERRNR
jgi:hypothetical protein